jgi:hypothetical protein
VEWWGFEGDPRCGSVAGVEFGGDRQVIIALGVELRMGPLTAASGDPASWNRRQGRILALVREEPDTALGSRFDQIEVS